MTFDPDVKSLLDGKNFAALSTLMPGGQPQTQIMWVDGDGDHVVVNTEVARQKYRNIEADPRVTITVFDAASPYRYAEVRGRVTETVGGDEARAHIDALSEKYTGGPYQGQIGSDRVIVKITPDKVHKWGF